MKKRLIVVLGMHRSGTSTIARGLLALGATFSDDLLPPAFDNPKGFWEDREIVQLNDSILAELHSKYDCIAPCHFVETLPMISALKRRAYNLLKQKMAKTSLYALKDPRMARLLPFWQSVFQQLDLKVSYVIAARNPLCIADSLKKRNQFEPMKSYLLWLDHTVHSLFYTKGKNRIVVHYDQLVDKPVEQLRRIAKHIFLSTPQPEALQLYLDNFLDASLRHARYSFEALRQNEMVPGEVIEIYQLLCACAEDEFDMNESAVESGVEQAYNWLSKHYSLLTFIASLDAKTQLQSKLLDEKTTQVNECNERLIALNQEPVTLNATCDKFLQENILINGSRFSRLRSAIYSKLCRLKKVIYNVAP